MTGNLRGMISGFTNRMPKWAQMITVVAVAYVGYKAVSGVIGMVRA